MRDDYWCYVRNWWTYIASYFIYGNLIPPMDLSIYLALDEELLKEADLFWLCAKHPEFFTEYLESKKK